MTPKEKAQQLVALFEYQDNLGIAKNTGIEGINENTAKECALIAVDEILNLIVGIYDYDYDSLNPYWQGVKQEINKL
jgi:hypothetical protein